MEAHEFLLTEVSLSGVDDKLQALFSYALTQVFSPSYVRKIEEVLSRSITVKEIVKNDENIVAYQSGNVIYVNKPVFYTKASEQKVQYLIHEMMHLLQGSKKMFFIQNFKELNVVSEKLYDVVSKNLVKTLPMFLTSKNVKLPTSGREEVIPYLANNKTDWSAITPEARNEFIKIMNESGLFNMKSRFWIKRLYKKHT